MFYARVLIFQIYADDVTNQMIMSLNVICDQYQEGCKWKGQLKKLKVGVIVPLSHPSLITC